MWYVYGGVRLRPVFLAPHARARHAGRQAFRQAGGRAGGRAGGQTGGRTGRQEGGKGGGRGELDWRASNCRLRLGGFSSLSGAKADPWHPIARLAVNALRLSVQCLAVRLLVLTRLPDCLRAHLAALLPLRSLGCPTALVLI